jgi:hypothetical protein
MTAELFIRLLVALASPEEREKIQRYFKGGVSGAIGVRMREVTDLAKEFVDLPPAELNALLDCPIREGGNPRAPRVAGDCAWLILARANGYRVRLSLILKREVSTDATTPRSESQPLDADYVDLMAVAPTRGMPRARVLRTVVVANCRLVCSGLTVYRPTVLPRAK